MKKIFFLPVAIGMLIVYSVSLFGQDKTVINDKNAEPRSVKGFHAIKVSDGIDLYLSYGDEAAAVSASEIKFRDRIKTEVENGVLKIWYDRDMSNQIVFTNKRNLRAYVSYKNLDMLTASAGCDVLVDGTIKGNSLTMKISSGSDFKGNVDVNELTVDQSSGSDIKIGGKANTVTIEASSGSDFNGYDLVAEVCTAKCSSGSDITITVNKELNANATSGSDINYKGNPAVTKSKSSGGSISRRD
ncbi:MAG: hypothetical protein JWN83_2523 [Chitinophagaceae bacterium]|nr:hypothetical protein [Chitinophagaceae bacterium]